MTTVTVAANKPLGDLVPGNVFKLRGRYWMVLFVFGAFDPNREKEVVDLSAGEPRKLPPDTEVQFFPEARLAGVL